MKTYVEMERDTQDVNYELRLLTTLDVFDDNIWIEPEPSGTNWFFVIKYSQDSEIPSPIVQIYGIFNSENLVGFCIIPNNFDQSSKNSVVKFSVDRNISDSSNKIQRLKIFNNEKKFLEDFLGAGSDKEYIEKEYMEVYGPVLVSVEGQPWEDIEEILTELNTFKVQTDPESLDSDYLQVTPKHGVYYLVGNSTDDFFDQEIAFILHEDALHSFFQNTNLPVNSLD
jgi:hypothetical protein